MQLKGLGKKKKAGKTWVKPLRLLGDNWVSQSCGAKKKEPKQKQNTHLTEENMDNWSLGLNP